MAELLPCPFCNFAFDAKRIDMADVLYPSGRMWRATEVGVVFISHKDQREGDRHVWTMHCPVQYGGCGVSVKGLSDIKVMEAWNRRASTWRPMSECPNGQFAVIRNQIGGVFTAKLRDGIWLDEAGLERDPIAWMPIPAYSEVSK